jgi:hypothetical protein
MAASARSEFARDVIETSRVIAGLRGRTRANNLAVFSSRIAIDDSWRVLRTPLSGEYWPDHSAVPNQARQPGKR